MNLYKKMFINSLKDRNGQIDHKRLTVFWFTIIFTITSTVVLFKKSEIPNKSLMETVLAIEGVVITGGMGLSMWKKPTKTSTDGPLEDELNEEKS